MAMLHQPIEKLFIVVPPYHFRYSQRFKNLGIFEAWVTSSLASRAFFINRNALQL